MSMVFAGFMAARKEDRLRQEEIELEEKRLQDDRDWQLELNDLTKYDAQKKIDDELAKNVDFFMSSYKIESKYRPSVAQYIESLGLTDTISMFDDGKLKFDPGRKYDASTFTPELEKLTGKYNLPEGYLVTTGMLESKLNPLAKNPDSSAAGMFQFTTDVAASYKVDVNDWKSSADGAARLARDNFNTLTQMLGREPTAAELYLAHQQGATGAANLLKSPTKLASDIVGSDAVKLNGGKLDMTADEFSKTWIDKYHSESKSGYAGLSASGAKITTGAAVSKPKSYSDYAEKAGNHDNALRQVSIAEMDGAPDDVIDRLNKLATDMLKKEMREKEIEAGINVKTVTEAVITNDDGSKHVSLVTFDTDGKTYIDGQEVKARRMTENESTQYFKVPAQTQKTARDYSKGTVAMAEGLRNAQQLMDLAERQPGVISSEGDLAQFLTGAARTGGSVLSVTNRLFDSKEAVNGEKFITQEELEAALREDGVYSGKKAFSEMNPEEFVDSLISSNVQALSQDTTVFEAQMISLAFRVGRLEGQSGNAMSNKDFDRIMEMVGDSKGDVGAFKRILHEYMRSKIKSNDDRVQTFNTTASGYGQFESIYGYVPYERPKTLAEFVIARDDDELRAAVELFRSPLAGTAEVVEPDAIDETDSAGLTDDDMGLPQEPVEETSPETPVAKPLKDKVEWANQFGGTTDEKRMTENMSKLYQANRKDENVGDIILQYFTDEAAFLSKKHGIELTADDLMTFLKGK